MTLGCLSVATQSTLTTETSRWWLDIVETFVRCDFVGGGVFVGLDSRFW